MDDLEVQEDDNRVDPNELDAKFQLLRKIENRKFIYDSRERNHSKREILSAAWEEIATDIKINGKEVSGKYLKRRRALAAAARIECSHQKSNFLPLF